jgi:hypothetical protein
VSRAHAGFRLSKWYLDLVTHDGEAFVAYHATLAWHGLAARWASVLHRGLAGETHTVTSARAGRAPAIVEGSVLFESRTLALAGRWEPLEREHEAELFRSHEGHVLWRCVAPRARVELTPADGMPRAGLGYAEELELTVAPWTLPIDELLWGRFENDATSLVWIEWRGPEPRKLVLSGGAVVEHAEILDDAVLLGGGERLVLSDRVTLREGRIGRTVLAALPRARRLPGALLAAEETKWRSRGTLTDARGATASGWAIHERVTFR